MRILDSSLLARGVNTCRLVFCLSGGIIGSAELRTVLGVRLPRSDKPTVSFNDSTTLDRESYPHSVALHLVECIRRVDHDSMEINLMTDIPKAYPKPWGARLDFQLRTDWRIMEPVCGDNVSFLGLITKATKKLSK